MLGIKYPIFQGGMAWIADHSLAAAVSNAGGLGIIAAGNAPADWLADQIAKTKAATKEPFGVNIMLLSPYVDSIVDVVCREKVPVVTTGAGNPGKYMKQFKEAGIRVVPVVPSVALARRLEQNGADAVIAEGCESGGHIGELTTMALVPQVVEAVSVPVIAAGGIGDGRGVAAAFCLGAEGVQVGTRFLVAKECTVHPNYKQRILQAKDTDTVATGRSTGHPVRVIKNKLTREFQKLEAECAPAEVLEALGAGKLALAAKDGDIDNGSVMVGQIAGLVRQEQTCHEIVASLFSEAAQLLRKMADNLPAMPAMPGAVSGITPEE